MEKVTQPYALTASATHQVAFVRIGHMTVQVTLFDADSRGCSNTSVLFLKLLPNINLIFSHRSFIVCCCARQPQFY